MDNKNAITMRNKFAVVANNVVKSGDLSKDGVNKGGGDSELSYKGENGEECCASRGIIWYNLYDEM